MDLSKDSNTKSARRPRIDVIQSTHASLAGLRQSGILEPFRRTLEFYSREFDVVLHSADSEDMSVELGVDHRPMLLPRTYGLRHLVYYGGLVLRARGMNGIICVSGSNIPTLGLIKRIAQAPLYVIYRWDYADVPQREFGARHWRAVLARCMESLALRSADLVAAGTEELRDKVTRVYRRPVYLLPNWIDYEGIRPCDPNERRHRTVMYAGRLHRIKGVDSLLRAFARVQVEEADAELLICGVGEQDVALRNLASELHLKHIQFLGGLENSSVLRLMCSTGVFVLPTVVREGQPRAVMEALTAGAACVVTDVPGSNSLVKDQVTGLVVPPGDETALADALLRLLRDPALQLRLGMAGRDSMATFDFAAVMETETAALLSLSHRRSWVARSA